MKNNKTFFIDKLFTLFCLMLIVLLLSNISVLSFLLISYKRSDNKKPVETQIVEIWNVDSFDAGNFSKTVFLENVASRLYVKNTGVCVVVKSMTREAVEYNFQNEIYPDMISYASDMKELVSNVLDTLHLTSDVLRLNKSIISNAENILGVSWCAGGYFLFGRNEDLEKQNIGKDDMLKNIANVAYKRKLKKRTIDIYSCVYGKNGIEDFEKFFELHNINSNVIKIGTSFDAYNKFINAGSVMLLGTQRDYCRLTRRENFENNYSYKLLTDYNNLFQYISIIKNNTNKTVLCEKYINYLLSDESQKNMDKFGMFSPVGYTLYIDESWVDLQSEFNKITNISEV